ncbi:MAG: hypothetical protein KDJ16_17130 [Hyphomicrobiales bacterium]|nr:hypothetical protein [Hyphomicrobiales bacterium]
MADFSIFDYSNKGGTFDNLKAYAQRKTLPTAPAPQDSIYKTRLEANEKKIAKFQGFVEDLNSTLTSLENSMRNLLKMQNTLREARNKLLDAQAAIIQGDTPEYDSRTTGSATLVAGNTLANYSIADGSTFEIQLASAGAPTEISFDSTSTVQDVLDDLNAVENVSAEITEDGNLEITATDGTAITLTDGTNTPLANLGLSAGTNTPVLLGNAGEDVDRKDLASIVKGMKATVDAYAGTAEYTPDNLLLGGSVKVRVSPTSSAAVPVFGKALNADAIGLTDLDTDILSDADIAQALDEIEAAIEAVDSFEFQLESTVDLTETFTHYADGRIDAMEKLSETLEDQLARDLAQNTRGGLSGSGSSLTGALGLLTGNAGSGL